MEKWKWLFIGAVIGLVIGGAFFFIQEVVERPAAEPVQEPEPDPVEEPVVGPEPAVWKAKLPLWVIEGQIGVGAYDFWMELEQLLGPISLLGGYPLAAGVEGHLEDIKASNTVFLISPGEEGLEELAGKYPELLPLSHDEIILYSPPFMYVAHDEETGMMRVLVIAHQVPDSLAKQLVEKGVPLEILIPLE